MEVSDAALLELAREGYGPVFGTLPLKRGRGPAHVRSGLPQTGWRASPVAVGAGSNFAPKDNIRVDAVDGRIEFEQVMEAELV